ncbi:hypothetical protein [uncultured Paludibaculum sp.]|uniref:hypothetical protein n=1 Tax=uncultured Paludibaculum sp. TaxID=1765020 RepID=UPI002AAC1F03|nr:hypothetical protein [uncultured Paludibaculum sp.]
MKRALSVFFSCFLSIATLSGGSVNYVVLQESDRDSLIRVSADGKTVSTIAHGAGGVDLTVDRAGNYVVAAKTALLRVTRAGEVSTIAKAPPGAEWESVIADRSGSLIVADGRKPILWRVSEDGQSVAKWVEFPRTQVHPGFNHTGLASDGSDGYLLLGYTSNWAFGNKDPKTKIPLFHQITANGEVTRIPVSGVTVTSSRRLIPDGSGSYLFLNVYPDDRKDRKVFHLSASGTVSEFADPGEQGCCMTGLVRNPGTGDVIITIVNRLLRVSADGATTSELCRYPKISFPEAIIVEPEPAIGAKGDL